MPMMSQYLIVSLKALQQTLVCVRVCIILDLPRCRGRSGLPHSTTMPKPEILPSIIVCVPKFSNVYNFMNKCVVYRTAHNTIKHCLRHSDVSGAVVDGGTDTTIAAE